MSPARPECFSGAAELLDFVPTNQKPLNSFTNGCFFVFGDFDHSIATEIIPPLVAEIERLKALNEGKATKGGKIRVYINSHGGWTMYAENVISLFEVAKEEGITVETYVFGYAYSCGSLVACAGSPGHRYVGPYAEHLCHLGRTGARAHNDVEHERETMRMKSHFEAIRAIYRKYAKIKNLDRVIRDDSLFIRGDAIIKNGLADKMLP